MPRPQKPWYRKGKDAWYATVGGRKVSLGVRGRKNRRAAYTAWHALVEASKDEARKPKPEATVSDVSQLYLADLKARAKINSHRVCHYFLTPFCALYGQLPVSSLTPTIAEQYSRKDEWSASSRAACLSYLVSCLRWAERTGLTDRNPVAGIRKPPQSSRGETALITPEEFALLLDAASPQFRLFLQVLYASGARPSEVAAITAENFDADAGFVRLPKHKTAHKTGRVRVIYLTPEAITLLERQREHYPQGPLLRTRKGTAWSCNTVGRAMQRTRERAGVPHAIAYGLRHSFATDALANGVPDAHVAELLGHQGTAMLHKHYSHLGQKAKALRTALDHVRPAADSREERQTGS